MKCCGFGGLILAIAHPRKENKQKAMAMATRWLRKKTTAEIGILQPLVIIFIMT